MFNQIKLSLDDFKTVNLSELFAISHPESVDLANTQINRYSISEIVNYSNNFFEQFEIEINNGNGIILPLTFNGGEYGQADIVNQISIFLTSIKAAQYTTVENILGWLLIYQLQNGFYNKSQYKTYPINLTEVKKIQSQIELQTKDIEALKTKHTKALEEIENQTKLLLDFKIQKENELTQISNNLETTNTNNNSIQNLLTSSTQSNTKIDAALADAEKNKQKINEILNEMEKSVSKSKMDSSTLVTSLEETESNHKKLYDEFDTKLKFVESKYEYFDERNTYLDNLIGREVGVSLFETFKQRKTELDRPIEFWRWAIGCMTIITVLGVFAIFTNLFGYIKSSSDVLTWEVIVINAIKSSPFIFLLYYTINQYNKERNFQEEYAFKSCLRA